MDNLDLNKIDDIINNVNYSVSDIIENLKKLNIKVSGEELLKMRYDLDNSRKARQITSYYRWVSYGLIGKHEFTSANIVNVVNKINTLLYNN